jgi:hypothetical protein
VDNAPTGWVFNSVAVDASSTDPSKVTPCALVSGNVNCTLVSGAGPGTYIINVSATAPAVSVTHDVCIKYTNTADSTATWTQIADATDDITVTCPVEEFKPPVVTKQGAGTYDSSQTWEVTKTVDQSTLDLGVGGNGTSNYTVVVTKHGPFNSNAQVTGTITIHNPNATLPITVNSVTDGSFTVVCPGGLPFTIVGGGADVVCTFSGPYSLAAINTGFPNTATVDYACPQLLLTDAAAPAVVACTATGQATINFTTTLKGATADVTDTNAAGPNETISDGKTYEYSVPRTCAGIVYNQDGGLTGSLNHPNTATVSWNLPGSDQASAGVTVTCHLPPGSLQISKVVNWQNWPVDANASFPICVVGPSLNRCDQYTNGQVRVFTSLTPGQYNVTETNPGSDWTVTGSGVNVNVTSGGAASATVTNTHRRAFVTLNAHKTEISLANPGGVNGVGWTFTISGCGASGSKTTTAPTGTVTFGPLDLVAGCTYTVSETGAAGWSSIAPVQPATFTTPDEVQTLLFTNIRNDPGCTNCAPNVVPTPVPPTTVPPTVVPPTTVPPTNTPVSGVLGERTPGPVQTVAGERTPGPPQTGSGPDSQAGSINVFLAVLGLLVLSAGLTLVAVGRGKNRA